MYNTAKRSGKKLGGAGAGRSPQAQARKRADGCLAVNNGGPGKPNLAVVIVSCGGRIWKNMVNVKDTRADKVCSVLE